MSRRLLLALLVMTSPLIVRADEKPKAPVDAKAIQKLVAQLGSDDFDTRESAGKRLLELDEAALPALRQAAKGSDAELRRSAGELAATIAARVEQRAIQKMLAEINGPGLSKFIERLAKEKDFATTERWKTVSTLVVALEKRASEVADRSFRVTKLDLAKLTTLRTLPATSASMARLVVSEEPSSIQGLYNCVVFSNGPLGRVGTLTNCVVIVNGDMEGVTIMRDCIVLCRGNIGRTRQIDHCILLTTGDVRSADTINNSLIDAVNVGRCWKSFGSVYLNASDSPANNSKDDKCVKTKRGPLQMIHWTPMEGKK